MKSTVSALRPKNISVHYGIKWIAEPVRYSDGLMSSVYKDRKVCKRGKLDLSLAYLMKSEFPLVTRDVLLEKVKDIKIIKDGVIVLATPQRLYSEWAHDFLKSDICVVGPVEKETKMIRLFKKLKSASIAKKSRALRYIQCISPYLDTLVVDGLVIGVLGRGSYFVKNGFPYLSVYDNIDFILFPTDSSKKTTKNIIKVLKKIPKFAVILIEDKDRLIKAGKHPAFSFKLVSKDMASHMKARRYASYARYGLYVLKESARISLPHLTKTESDVIAKKFIGMLSAPK